MASMFPLRMRQLRQSRSLTQAQLSQRFDVCRGAISHFERGAREPEYAMLIKIADEFGVTVDYLLRGERTNEKE